MGWLLFLVPWLLASKVSLWAYEPGPSLSETGPKPGVQSIKRYPSPSGRFEVSFGPAGPSLQTDPDRTSPTDQTARRKYRVGFYRPGTSAAIALTDYFDVLESKSADATGTDLLTKGILWSPQEDVAVLPAEKWEIAPAAIQKSLPAARFKRQVVSLNRSFPWETASFPFADTPLVWIDALRVAGNITESCRRAVGLWDAKTGKMTLLSDATSPLGYQIVGESKGNLVMKKVLDECATDRDRATFKEDCLLLNVSFMRREIGRCP